ncbi:MAG: hypothetical protein KJ042_04355, partial [Deltaproteobacteria bacterium]|nr:hypothetical protein [Deltaproteobacteria bacterium]
PHNLLRPIHFYHIDFIPLECLIDQAMNLWKNTGMMWGYVPQYLAGYADPFLWNSNVTLNFIAIAFPRVAPWQLLYYMVVLTAFVVPLCVYLGMREFGVPRRAALFGLFFSLLGFCCGFGIFLLVVGMIMAVLVAGVCVYAFGVFANWLAGERWIRPALLILPLAPIVHKTAIFILAGPCLVSVLVYRREMMADKRKIAVLAGLIGLALAANWFWIGPYLDYKDILDFSFNRFFHGLEFLLQLEIAWPWIIAGILLLYRLLMWCFGVAGAVHAIRSRAPYRRHAIVISISLVYMIGLIASGDYIPGLHSARYEINLLLFVSVLCGMAMEAQRAWPHWKQASRLKRTAALIIPFVAWYGWMGTYRMLMQMKWRAETPPTAFMMKEMNTLPLVELRRAALYIKRHSPDDARAFLEHSMHTNNLHYRFHNDSGRPLINGPFDGVFFKQNDINFQFNLLLRPGFSKYRDHFRLPVELRYQFHDFERIAETFNVRWFVVTEPWRLKELVKLTEGRVVDHGEFGRFGVFEFTHPGGWFLRGSGDLSWDFGYLSLKNVKPDPTTNDIVLKWHWFADLKTTDGRAVESFVNDDVRAGFIRIENPGDEFTIRLKR